MVYYFGVYHWRAQLRSVAAIGGGVLIAGAALLLPWPVGPVVAALALAAGAHWGAGVGRLLRPRPWSLDRSKYDALAGSLPLADADRVLDVGCGTGRSLVGLGPHLPGGCSITGVDRFDDRVILGNSPRLARRNAAAAGVDASLVVGDATDLPLADGSHDVVTASMVLHDLPEVEIRSILGEMRRVCSPDGTVGLFELPLVDDSRRVPPDFWVGLLEDAGFAVDEVRAVPWKADDHYALLTGTPETEGAADGTVGEPRTERKLDTHR